MYKKLLQLLLVVHLGRHAHRSARAATMRLAVATLCAVGLGVLVGAAIWRMALPRDIPLAWMGSFVALAAFVLTSLLLLSIGIAADWSTKQTTLSRMAATWPLSRAYQWMLAILPLVFVLVLALLTMMPIVVAVAHATGSSYTTLLGALIFGLGAGLGFGLLNIAQSAGLKVLLFVGAISLDTTLLENAVHYAGHRIASLCLVALGAVLTAFYVGLWQSYRSADRSPPADRGSTPRIVLPRNQAYSWWFLTKLLRNRRTSTSCLFCLLLISAASIGVSVRHLAASGGAGWLLFPAMLVSTYAADVRGLMRYDKPPEIVALRGVTFFMLNELQATFVTGLVIGLPLFIVVLLGSHIAVATLGLLYVALQSAGVGAGLLASTVFVPQVGEVGAQFFAALMSVVILFGTLRFGRVGEMSPVSQSITWLALAALCSLLTYIIEQKRSKNYGRT